MIGMPIIALLLMPLVQFYLMTSFFSICVKEYTNQAFFAVYDGHSGVDASSYAATHLHCHLARNKHIDTDPGLALKQAFEKTDECFVAKAKREVRRLRIFEYILRCSKTYPISLCCKDLFTN